jgi:hypothetical protein
MKVEIPAEDQFRSDSDNCDDVEIADHNHIVIESNTVD